MAHRWCNRLLLLWVLVLRASVVAQTAATPPADPAAFLQELYSQVVRYQPLGTLDYEYVGHPTRRIVEGSGARTRFMPYLSEAIRHRIERNDSCLKDWQRLHRKSDVPLKPPIFEGGVFSGTDEESGPERFKVEKIETKNDGSVHALVQLSGRVDPPKWTMWRVEVILIRERGRLVVGELFYDPPRVDDRLSEAVSVACER